MVNQILRTKKYGEFCEKIVEMMEEPCRVALTDTQEPADGGFVFRWGSTATILRSPSAAFTEVNTAKSIKTIGNKGEFRSELYNHGLTMWTCLDVTTVGQSGYEPDDGWVLRPRKHMQGQGFHHHFTYEGLSRRAEEYGEGEYYISEYIKKDREFRVQVVQGRVLYMYEKRPTYANQETWGSEDSTEKMLDWGDWNLKVAQSAIEAMRLSGLTFGAVDVITHGYDTFVLEINSSPDLRSEYRQKKFAKAFDYMIRNGIDPIETTGLTSWKHFIHPVNSELAICA